MKKLIFTAFILCLSSYYLLSQAPSYKNFEWDVIKIGGVLPNGEGVTSGYSFGGELRLNARDDLSIGFRYEFAVFGHDFDDSVDIGAADSWVVTSDYYLNTHSAYRAYGGLGFGAFTPGTFKIENDDGTFTQSTSGSSVGIVPRIGYEFGHLRLSAEYNILFKEDASNYFSFNAALTLWGGYNGKSSYNQIDDLDF